MPHIRQHRGFSLLDLLIGMVIMLFGMLAVAVVFRDFGQQRTTQTQTSETQSNGTMALYLIERDLNQAGYGLMTLQTCPYINYYYNVAHFVSPNSIPTPGQAQTANNIALTTFPVRIIDGGTGSDTLEVQFSNSTSGTVGSNITSAFAYPGDVTLKSVAGMSAGPAPAPFDLVVLNNNAICTLMQASVISTASNTVTISASGSYNPAAAPGGGWNSVSLSDLNATPAPYLADLGPAGNFVSRRYQAVNTGNTWALSSGQFPDFSSTSTVVEDIVFLKAQYGLATAAQPTVVSSWVDGSFTIDNTNTNTSAYRVIAIRVGVIARSPLLEKTTLDQNGNAVPVTPNANITILPPAPGFGPSTATAPTSAPTDPGQCNRASAPAMDVICRMFNPNYRYRAYSTIVPLKNVIWSN